ncbi:MAG: biotin--[acetyl-CoA-carboxylase] ligase [Desulfocapsaceae bacterium]|nr:biotin--[acetyl-CoA-carboxylase] ligase [Desulfocapsaceae bacterium]
MKKSSGAEIEDDPTGALRRFVADHELPLRRQVHGDLAAAVLRYGAFVGSAIQHYPRLTRAMDQARAHIAAQEAGARSVASGTVITAGSLSDSRGRFARRWFAPAGGFWGCLIHANTLLPASRSLLPLAVGVACCEAIRQAGAFDARLRWVNDVLLDGKKVAGSLIQGFSGPQRQDDYDLIGFGVNLNNRIFPEELRESATSLAASLGRPIDLPHFQSTFLAKLTWNLGLLYFEEAKSLREEGFSGAGGEHLLLHGWKELSDTIGRRIVFGQDLFETPLYEATVTGLRDDGALMMRLDDGSSLAQLCGEIRYCPGSPEAKRTEAARPLKSNEP